MSRFDKPTREVGARINHNASQATTTATPTVLSLNTTRRANGVTVGADRLTALEAGWYVVAGHVSFAANATGLRQMALKLSGASVYLGIATVLSASGAIATNLSVATVHYLAAGDYVQIEVYQDSGGSLNVLSANNYSPELAMMKLPGLP
ncbi:MAG: hypothetical protein QOH04_2598 [Sphingomonadales bacterium]|jgi:hypothetical protein|nr:hypothetical protein [Sphingomonadales bacterium]